MAWIIYDSVLEKFPKNINAETNWFLAKAFKLTMLEINNHDKRVETAIGYYFEIEDKENTFITADVQKGKSGIF
ncbi:hypothetical protein Glove_117g365 [Diversispora epigaea]|uniref:Uncharacterized protein n=1 Tax=Diversispora epigaea TaxID=1348612 RepID=A0A397J068_9GLOM|nr:hypothetical protein Glove_117g365 [Diversispora epigaea]